MTTNKNSKNINSGPKTNGQRNRGTAPMRKNAEARSELRPVTKSKPQPKVPSVHK